MWHFNTAAHVMRLNLTGLINNRHRMHVEINRAFLAWRRAIGAEKSIWVRDLTPTSLLLNEIQLRTW